MASSLARPHVGGWVRFSRGTAYLMPQGSTAAATATNGNGGGGADAAGRGGQGAAAAAAAAAEALGLGGGSGGGQGEDVVARAFSLLKAGRRRAIFGSLAPVRGQAGRCEHVLVLGGRARVPGACTKRGSC